MIQNYVTTILGAVQNLPFGERIIEIIASGMRVLAVLVVVWLCLTLRGWINYGLADAEERKRLHDGNAAFIINQLFVVAAFAISCGAALVNTRSLADFSDKVIIALAVQLIAMLAIRIRMRKTYHAMLAGNVGAGVRLGIIILLVGIVTAFEMMR